MFKTAADFVKMTEALFEGSWIRAISREKVVKQAGMLLLGPVRFASGWEV